MLETVGFSETRLFLRGVLTDLAIADAMGIFAPDRGEDGS